jgi:hypothetical protein
MSDELSGDIKRDEMVSKGKMSQADADKERELWTKVCFAQCLFRLLSVCFGMVATI